MEFTNFTAVPAGKSVMNSDDGAKKLTYIINNERTDKLYLYKSDKYRTGPRPKQHEMGGSGMSTMKAKVNGAQCKSCGVCMMNCPKQAISRSGKFNANGYDEVVVDQELCIGCGICYTVCPDYVFEIS